MRRDARQAQLALSVSLPLLPFMRLANPITLPSWIRLSDSNSSHGQTAYLKRRPVYQDPQSPLRYPDVCNRDSYREDWKNLIISCNNREVWTEAEHTRGTDLLTTAKGSWLTSTAVLGQLTMLYEAQKGNLTQEYKLLVRCYRQPTANLALIFCA